MSIEDLFLNRRRPEPGHSATPLGEQVLFDRKTYGGAPAIEDLGHREHGQTMHRHMELRTHSETCEVRTDGRVAPGETAAVVQKVTGDTAINLITPPSVPAAQKSVSGSVRRQMWATELWVYNSASASITWPASVRWCLGGQPANPRPAGTADVFGVRYITATGEWWVIPLAEAVPADEPTDPGLDTPQEPGPNDGGEGNGEQEPGDDGAPDPGLNPPEHTYTDPETGQELAPEQPPALSGNLVALHSGAVSLSQDCGSTWRVLSAGVPQGAKQFSTLAVGGTALVTDAGSAWFSDNLQTWARILIGAEVAEALPLVNPDFESGDFAGWDVRDNAAPVVSASTAPSQRPGSSHYLARDPAAADGGTYTLAQDVEATPGDAKVRLSTDVYAEAGAEVELQLTAPGSTQGFVGFAFEGHASIGAGGVYTVPSSFRKANGSILSSTWRVMEIPDENSAYIQRVAGGGLRFYSTTRATNNGKPNGEFVLEVSFPEPVSGEFEIQDLDIQGGIRDRIRFVGIDGSIDATPSAGTFTITPPHYYAEGAGCALRVSLTDCRIFQIGFVGYAGGQTINFVPQASQRAAASALSDQASGDWHRISCEIAGGAVGAYEVRVTGRGSPANAYIDNIRLDLVSTRNEAAGAIARDLAGKRHVIATADSLHARSGAGLEYLAPAPIPAARLAAHGDILILSSGDDIRASRDGGKTFEAITAPAPVSHVIAHPEPVAVCEDGSILRLTEGGPEAATKLSAGVSLLWSSRYSKWIATTAAGGVQHSTDLISWSSFKSQPIGGTAARRSFAAESGRLIGYGLSSKDIFFSDAPADGWKLSRSLTLGVLDISEMM
jgi:hypothetical protein